MLLTNKHFVVAMIVAPILAVIAYFAVDASLSEPAHVAVKGQTYALAAASNCRYESGRCTFKNGDFKLTLDTESRSAESLSLRLVSAFPLQDAKLAVAANSDAVSPPIDMQPLDETGLQWSVNVALPESESPRLRLVVASNETIYHGESGLDFTVYETAYQRDFRRNEP
ncbi:MAG: hypothetical protein ACSHWQ_05610 [Spongiibacteraceae bacterium]